MDVINQVLALLHSAYAQAGVIAIVVEFALRLIPSQKPLSILHGIGAVCRGLGNICIGVADLLDKVLPQNVSQ
jgi:hypothetical protein